MLDKGAKLMSIDCLGGLVQRLDVLQRLHVAGDAAFQLQRPVPGRPLENLFYVMTLNIEQ